MKQHIKFLQENDVTVVLSIVVPGDLMHMAAKTPGKGTYLRKAPEPWEVRRDSPAPTHRGSKRHFHCSNKNTNEEIVINIDGTGSHHTVTGDIVCSSLGDFLVNNQKVDLKKDDTGLYKIKFIVDSDSVEGALIIILTLHNTLLDQVRT
ncbi:hypothetical protein [Shewanella algae]|uniref:hypothetical protein n=1 Tax=Shewanella algae TaxID=38313 RepID=UPI0005CCC6A9|nr:hypothetical protein [Shewanella algae]